MQQTMEDEWQEEPAVDEPWTDASVPGEGAPEGGSPKAAGEEWEDLGEGAEGDAAAAPPRPPPATHGEGIEVSDWTPLRPTPRFWITIALVLLLAAASAVIFPYFGMVWGLLAAGLAAALALDVILTSVLVALARRRVHIEATRALDKERLTVGDRFTVTFDVSGSRIPHPFLFRVRDDPGPAIHPLLPPLLKQPESLTYEAVAQQRGEITLPGFHVLLRDWQGMWKEEYEYKLASKIQVDPGLDGQWFRRFLTGQASFGDEMPRAVVHLFRDMEQEVVREFQPGDRTKDVDWKRVSITGEMMVRERRNISEDMVLILVDAGTSMTIGRDGQRNLDRALEFVREIVTEGNKRNLAVGYMAFDDRHLLDHLPPSRARNFPRLLQDHLVRLGDPKRLDREEDERLHAVKMQSLDVAVAQAIRTGAPGKMSILLFSDLDSVPEPVVQTISRTAPKGYRCGVFLFPPPPPAVKKVMWRHGARPAHGYRGKRTRKVLRELLVGHGVEFLDLRYRYK